MHVYTTECGAVTAAHTPMPTDTNDDTPVGEFEFDRIVTRWSNPKIAGTPAWRLNGMIHQPDIASELVRTAIITKTVEALRDPSKTLTRRYAHYLCSRVSIEKILNDQYGMAPTLVRQASKYETLRLKLRGGDGRGHRELSDEDIWDMAARQEADRQMAAFARGERKWMRWPPLHDGMSTNPDAHRRLKCGGLDQWRELTQAAALDGNRPHYNIDDGLQIGDMRVDVADEALGLVDGSGGIDRQWLADHHITSSMINELGDDRLLAMGLDPQELRAAAASLDASDATVACPVDASAPRRLEDLPLPPLDAKHRRAAERMDDVVDDPVLCLWLVAGYHGHALQPDAVLSHYGFPVRLARTGLRAKRLPMDDKTVVDVWSEACGQLNALARPRGATPGPAGYMEFQRTVERFRMQMRTRILRRLAGRRKVAHPTGPQPVAPRPVECR